MQLFFNPMSLVYTSTHSYICFHAIILHAQTNISFKNERLYILQCMEGNQFICIQLFQ